MDDVFIARPNVGDGEHAGERVLIVIGENAGVFIVCAVDGPCHCLFVARRGGFEEGFGVLNGLGNRHPRRGFNGFVHLVGHLLVGDVAHLVLIVIGEITKVYQYGENIIFASYDAHVVEKSRRINIHVLSCKHTDDVVLQTFEVHLDVSLHRVVRTGGSPVALARTALQGFHDGVRIVD